MKERIRRRQKKDKGKSDTAEDAEKEVDIWEGRTSPLTKPRELIETEKETEESFNEKPQEKTNIVEEREKGREDKEQKAGKKRG